MHVALNDPASGTTRLSLNVPALPPGLSRAAPAMLLPSVPPSIWAPARALGLDASALAAMATLAGPNAQAIPGTPGLRDNNDVSIGGHGWDVLVSGFGWSEENVDATQLRPRLGDFAVLKLAGKKDAPAAEVLSAGLFDDFWRVAPRP